MKIQRFFNKDIKVLGEKVVLNDPKIIHQLRNVFRFKSGDKLALFSGNGVDLICDISEIGRGEVTFYVKEITDSPAGKAQINLNLAVSMIKKDKMEWVLQKGTELGVSSFIPIIAARSEKKNLNYERVNKIITEASEQSGRGCVPSIEKTVSLENYVSRFEGKAIALDGDGDEFSHKSFSGTDNLTVFVGPEGGFTEGELSLFKKHSIPVLSLGSATLRAETASVAILTLILIGK